MSGENASVKAIHCQTMHGEKSFTIDQHSVAFHHDDKDGRSISSTHNMKTQNRIQGMDKVAYINGLRHKIHIDNMKSFNDADDFLSITNKFGHQMTYPLNCQAL